MTADAMRNTTAIAQVRREPPGTAVTFVEGAELRVVRGTDGIVAVETAEAERLAVLEPAPDDAGGWILQRHVDDAFLGRTTPIGVDDDPAHAASILMPDGRVFHTVAVVDRDARVELRGWETSGAYLEARPVAGGWRIDATVAGLGLEPERDLLLLWIAELTESRSDRGIRGET